MTPAELREAAEVMRRAADGEQVQWRWHGRGEWTKTATSGALWDWKTTEYRIAPKPREVWLAGCTAFATLEAAERYACTGQKPRLFREVLDEQGGAAC